MAVPGQLAWQGKATGPLSHQRGGLQEELGGGIGDEGASSRVLDQGFETRNPNDGPALLPVIVELLTAGCSWERGKCERQCQTEQFAAESRERPQRPFRERKGKGKR